MENVIVIVSILTVAAQQALANGADWRRCLALPRLARKSHPLAGQILSTLTGRTNEDLALLRALPVNPAQEAWLPPHLFLVVATSDIEGFKAELAAALDGISQEFEDLESAMHDDDDLDESDEPDEPAIQ